MKMFLIDPTAKTVTSIDAASDFITLYMYIGDGCTQVARINNAFTGYKDVMYVNAVGELDPNGTNMFVTPLGVFTGRAIVMSVMGGKSAAPTIDLNEIRAQVFFPGLMKEQS